MDSDEKLEKAKASKEKGISFFQVGLYGKFSYCPRKYYMLLQNIIC